MKFFAILMVLLVPVLLIGCDAFSQGLTGEMPDTLTKAKAQIESVKKEAEETGKVDIGKILEAFNAVQGAVEKERKEKMPWYEWVAYMVGIAAGTYIGTRKLRQGAIGTLVNKILGVKTT